MTYAVVHTTWNPRGRGTRAWIPVTDLQLKKKAEAERNMERFLDTAAQSIMLDVSK